MFINVKKIKIKLSFLSCLKNIALDRPKVYYQIRNNGEIINLYLFVEYSNVFNNYYYVYVENFKNIYRDINSSYFQ